MSSLCHVGLWWRVRGFFRLGDRGFGLFCFTTGTGDADLDVEAISELLLAGETPGRTIGKSSSRIYPRSKSNGKKQRRGYGRNQDRPSTAIRLLRRVESPEPASPESRSAPAEGTHRAADQLPEGQPRFAQGGGLGITLP